MRDIKLFRKLIYQRDSVYVEKTTSSYDEEYQVYNLVLQYYTI